MVVLERNVMMSDVIHFHNLLVCAEIELGMKGQDEGTLSHSSCIIHYIV